MNIFSKILNTFIFKTFGAIFNLLIAIIVSQYFGAEGKGVQGLLIMTISFILIFSNIICGATLVYLTPRYSIKNILWPAYIWSIIIGILAFPILYLFEPTSINLVTHTIMLTVLNSLFSININILIGKEEIKKANFIQFLQTLFVVIFLFMFILFKTNKSINIYINSLYISYLLIFIISLIALKKHIKKETKNDLKRTKQFIYDSFKYGTTNQITHILQLLNFRLSFYLLDYYFSKSEVGIYSNGVSVSEAVWLISGSICLVQFSKISNMNNKLESQLLTTKLAKIGVLISLFLIAFLAIIPSEVYEFVFGKEFGSMRYIILAMLPGIFIFNYTVIYDHYFSGIGKYYYNALSSVIGLFFTLSLAPLLISNYNTIGAAYASSISQIATASFLMIIYKKEANIKLKDFLPDYKTGIETLQMILNKLKTKQTNLKE